MVNKNEWKNFHSCPPPNEVPVLVTGDDCMGDWTLTLMRKDYKQKPTNTKRFYKANDKYWRWVYVDGLFAGTTVDDKDVPDLWKHKD